jgi:hypothetical protein
MKKAGIVTFHHAQSYGALLQTYALQQFMLDNGIDNEVVNYRCKFLEERTHPFRYFKEKTLRQYVVSFLYARQMLELRRKVESFGREYLRMTPSCTPETVSRHTEHMELLISGSDQVFNPDCAGLDPVYFLEFAPDHKKCSYAASFGPGNLTDEERAICGQWLAGFQHLSLREQSGRNLARELTGKEAQVHVDPTFLLTRQQWDTFLPGKARKPYIFLFTVLKPRRLVDYALKLSEQTGLGIVWLSYRHRVKDKRITYIDSVSANEFVELVRNAEYVCTNSFHGNAFSLIYQKQFVVETDTCSGENTRSRELMERLGLSSRVLAGENWPEAEQTTDWSVVEAYFNKERECSRMYLLSIAK